MLSHPTPPPHATPVNAPPLAAAPTVHREPDPLKWFPDALKPLEHYANSERSAHAPSALKPTRPSYVRARDLPRLVPLWPGEISDHSTSGRRLILARLQRALRAQRRDGRAGHWSYDPARHAALLAAARDEAQALARHKPTTRSNIKERSHPPSTFSYQSTAP